MSISYLLAEAETSAGTSPFSIFPTTFGNGMVSVFGWVQEEAIVVLDDHDRPFKASILQVLIH